KDARGDRAGGRVLALSGFRPTNGSTPAPPPRPSPVVPATPSPKSSVPGQTGTRAVPPPANGTPPAPPELFRISPEPRRHSDSAPPAGPASVPAGDRDPRYAAASPNAAAWPLGSAPAAAARQRAWRPRN